MGHKKELESFIDFTSEQLREQWKEIAGKKIWVFAKHHAPINVKLTGRLLYVDNKERTNALILKGAVPYASQMRRWKAPINKREAARPHPVWDDAFGWRTIRTKTKLTDYPGMSIREVDYGGGRGQPDKGYFGLRKDGKIMAYGITPEGEALPVFSDESVVEWLYFEQRDEIDSIIESTKKDIEV